jgi:hypothetical protein
MIFGIRRKTILKNMSEKTLYQAGITSQFGRILGRHTSRRIYMSGIYSAHDVRSFYTTLTIRCGDLEPTNSRFDYHAH